MRTAFVRVHADTFTSGCIQLDCLCHDRLSRRFRALHFQRLLAVAFQMIRIGQLLTLHPRASSVQAGLKMNLLPFYPCLLAILLQAALTSFISKGPGGSKPVAGTLVKKRKLSDTNKRLPVGKSKRVGKSTNVVAKPRLSDMLPAALVRIVIDYFNDNQYSILVSMHTWTLTDKPEIAVDSTRLYVITESDGIKGLDHSPAVASEDECHYVELGDPHWLNYKQFSSSRDGQRVFFSHEYRTSSMQKDGAKHGAKWIMQSNVDGRLRSVILDDEPLGSAVLSQDGQALFSCRDSEDPVTRVYRVREEAGEDPAGFIALELAGTVRAVSGRGNRVILAKTGHLEVHDVGKDASKRVCEIGGASSTCTCALNENGSEAAFVTTEGDIQTVKLDMIIGTTADQSAIATVETPASVKWIHRLVYAEEGTLYMLHDQDKISLVDPLTKELTLLKVSEEEGQEIDGLVISQSAGHVAFLQVGDMGEMGQALNYRTVVKRRLGEADWRQHFGYKAE